MSERVYVLKYQSKTLPAYNFIQGAFKSLTGAMNAVTKEYPSLKWIPHNEPESYFEVSDDGDSTWRIFEMELED